MSRCLVPTAFGNTPTGSTRVVEQGRVFVVPSEGIQGAPDRLGGRGGRDGDDGLQQPGHEVRRACARGAGGDNYGVVDRFVGAFRDLFTQVRRS
jgi:hypothetical protein